MFVAAQMLYHEYQISYIRYHASSSFFCVNPTGFFLGNRRESSETRYCTLFHPFPRCVPPHPLVNSSISTPVLVWCCMVLYVVKSHVS